MIKLANQPGKPRRDKMVAANERDEEKNLGNCQERCLKRARNGNNRKSILMKMLRLMKQAKTSLARSSRALMVLCAGSLLMLASQAQAGEWVFSCERTSGTSSGTYSVLPGDPTQMPPVSETFSFDWPSNKYTDPNNDYQTKYPWFPWLRNVSPAGAGAFGSAWANSSIGAGKVAVTGDMKVVATWTLRAGETTLGPVPPSLNVLVSASTQAAACNSYDQNNAAVAAQRDATGEDGKADVTVDGAQAAKSSSVTAGSSQWRASAARLFNLKTNGQSRVEVTTVNLSAQGNIPDGRSYYVYPNANNPNIPQSQWYTTKLKIALRGFVNASGSVGATEDPRTLTISRGVGAKRWDDPKLNKDRDEWVEADGTGHGHTIYSYKHRYKPLTLIDNGGAFPETESVPNQVEIVSSYSGSWTVKSGYSTQGNLNPFMLDVTSEWSPSNDETNVIGRAGDIQTHFQTMPEGGLTKDTYGRISPVWTGQGSSSTSKIITYTATDNRDQAKAKARYELTVHEPWEIITHNTKPDKLNYRPYPGGDWVDATADGDTITGQVTHDESWDVGVTFGLKPSEALAPLVGVDVSVTHSASTGVTVGNEHNNVRKGYRCRVMIWDAVIKHWGTANEWDTNGYVGSGPQAYEVYEPDNPAGGMHLGPLEWGGDGPAPPGGPTVNDPAG